jgi:hypothetical protein
MDDVITFPMGKKIDSNVDFEAVRAASAAASISKTVTTPINKSDANTLARPAGGSNASSPSTFTSVSTWPPVVTASMANWNKKFHELPNSELAGYADEYTIGGPKVTNDKAIKEDAMVFMVDDEEMFIATSLAADDEYFVAL